MSLQSHILPPSLVPVQSNLVNGSLNIRVYVLLLGDTAVDCLYCLCLLGDTGVDCLYCLCLSMVHNFYTSIHRRRSHIQLFFYVFRLSVSYACD